ncbi:hypothetical protein GGD56_005693 [Rhizobium mongolense]|uniref:Uncharacterized protein n=2 Tax=Rhizobium mongolense TaxID=57676 RepID=A0ABR6IV72_9HYPH|nr:hypothetical protein [Rhizobium mongolense]TVZ66760.1 hypothetical protein BCL32_7180 [Rhizobium mongolense USDA 1844]
MAAVGIVGIPVMSSSARHCKRQFSQYGAGHRLPPILHLRPRVVKVHEQMSVEAAAAARQTFSNESSPLIYSALGPGKCGFFFFIHAGLSDLNI